MSASFGQEELMAGVLYEFCKATDEVSKAACRFYILGAVQGVSLGDGARMLDRRLVERKRSIFCTPNDMPVDQMVAIFVKNARLLEVAYPEDLKSPAVSIVAGAISQAYPCRN
jgi:hypothetical protein